LYISDETTGGTCAVEAVGKVKQTGPTRRVYRNRNWSWKLINSMKFGPGRMAGVFPRSTW